MSKFSMEFKRNLYWHIFLVSVSASVFLWVIPLISWVLPVPVAVLFWFMHKKAGGGKATSAPIKHFNPPNRSTNYRSF